MYIATSPDTSVPGGLYIDSAYSEFCQPRQICTWVIYSATEPNTKMMKMCGMMMVRCGKEGWATVRQCVNKLMQYSRAVVVLRTDRQNDFVLDETRYISSIYTLSYVSRHYLVLPGYLPIRHLYTSIPFWIALVSGSRFIYIYIAWETCIYQQYILGTEQPLISYHMFYIYNHYLRFCTTLLLP